MYFAITEVVEYPITKLSRGDCYRHIQYLYTLAKKSGEATIYLSKNRQHYIRVSYDNRKYHSYISSRLGDYLLAARSIIQLSDLLYAILPATNKILINERK